MGHNIVANNPCSNFHIQFELVARLYFALSTRDDMGSWMWLISIYRPVKVGSLT